MFNKEEEETKEEVKEEKEEKKEVAKSTKTKEAKKVQTSGLRRYGGVDMALFKVYNSDGSFKIELLPIE